MARTVETVSCEYTAHAIWRSLRDDDEGEQLRVIGAHLADFILADVHQKRMTSTEAITPFLGGVGALPIDELTPALVEQFRDRLFAAGLTVKRTQAVLETLSDVLEYAIWQRYLDVNVAWNVVVVGDDGEDGCGGLRSGGSHAAPANPKWTIH